MEPLLSLITTYGPLVYVILFGYCALKSGTLPLFAGYVAQTGALEIGLVGLASFAGGYLGDELRFWVARRYGDGWLHVRPRLQGVMRKAETLLQRYGSAYMLIYRYPKGMRTIGALPVGLTDITWQRFTLLNAFSALLWSVLLVGGGYVFGQPMIDAISANWQATGLALLIIFMLGVSVLWRRILALPSAPNETVKE